MDLDFYIRIELEIKFLIYEQFQSLRINMIEINEDVYQYKCNWINYVQHF